MSKGDSRLMYVLLAVFLAFRLFYLDADPSGPYMNTDEQHHSYDARKIVLYGTPFYDSYTPSVLMPFFTLVKLPSMAIFGVGYVGLRIPSVLAVMFAAYLMCWILQQRQEYLCANLVMFYVGASYFLFSHSRLGIHEPVLMFLSALTFFLLYYAFETGKTSYYVWTFICALTVPLTKTSGVFVYGSLGLCLLYKFVFDRKRLNVKGVVAGCLASVLILLLLTAFWFYPHRVELARQVAFQLAPKRSDPVGWIQSLFFITVDMSPFITLMCLVSSVRFVDSFITEPRQCDHLQLILLSWALCAYGPLVYSSLWFPRWMMWMALPLTVLGIREFVNLASGPRKNASRQIWVRRVSVAVFAGGVLAVNVRSYLEYYRTMDFTLTRLMPRVEALVGTNVCSGSGFDFFVLSPKVNFVSSNALTIHKQDCEEIRTAFPTEAKTPQFIGWHGRGDPSKFDEILRQWYAACPEWKAQYKPFAVFRRIDYGGAYDLWLVRTNEAPARLMYFNLPETMTASQR